MFTDTVDLARSYEEDVLREWRENATKREARDKAEHEKHKWTLHRAIVNAYESARKYMSGEFGEPTQRDVKQFIFSAVQGRYHSCRTWLLKFGGVPGAIDSQSHLDGKTALCVAAANGDEKLARLLLERRANAKIKDCFGRTAAHYAAAAAGKEDLLEMILYAGADVDARDNNGVTPLMRACANGNLGCVEVLLEFGAALDLRDKIHKWGAIHYAAKANEVECLLALVGAGAKLRLLSRERETAHDIALNANCKDVAMAIMDWRKKVKEEERMKQLMKR